MFYRSSIVVNLRYVIKTKGEIGSYVVMVVCTAVFSIWLSENTYDCGVRCTRGVKASCIGSLKNTVTTADR